MGQVGNEVLARESDLPRIIDGLDRLCCYHMTGLCWSPAVSTRLEGQALFLLSEEIEEVAEERLGAARALAHRVSELGEAVTTDPTHSSIVHR